MRASLIFAFWGKQVLLYFSVSFSKSAVFLRFTIGTVTDENVQFCLDPFGFICFRPFFRRRSFSMIWESCRNRTCETGVFRGLTEDVCRQTGTQTIITILDKIVDQYVCCVDSGNEMDILVEHFPDAAFGVLPVILYYLGECQIQRFDKLHCERCCRTF